MRLLTVLKIAFKNLWAHRLRTTITIIGVTIGIGAIIFLVSFGYGLEQLVTNQVANFNAFTIIDVPAANIKTIQIDQKVIDRIQQFGHVKTVAGVANIAGRIRKSDGTSTAETVIVAAKDDYWKLADINIDKGSLPQRADEVVVNQSVLSLMGENYDQAIGKDIKLDLIISAELRTNTSDGLKLVENSNVKIVGLSKDSKSPVVYSSSDLLIQNEGTKYSSLKVKIEKKDYVEVIRKQIENIGFSTEYVGDTVNEIAQVFSMFRAVLAAFGLIALIVAALGTFNTLTISLLERIKEVGLFKALGMRNVDIYKLFLAESVIIGVSGGLLGLAIGIGLGHGINLFLSFLATEGEVR